MNLIGGTAGSGVWLECLNEEKRHTRLAEQLSGMS